MSDGAVGLVRGIYTSFSRGDIGGVLAVLSPTIDWRCPEVLPQGGDYQGPEGVQAFFVKLAEAWGDIEVELEDVIDGSEIVVVLGRTSGTAKSAGGARVEYPFAHVWRVRDDVVVSWIEYLDPGPVLAANVSGAST